MLRTQLVSFVQTGLDRITYNAPAPSPVQKQPLEPTHSLQLALADLCCMYAHTAEAGGMQTYIMSISSAQR